MSTNEYLPKENALQDSQYFQHAQSEKQKKN